MTQEEKARAYDEAIIKAKELYNQGLINPPLEHIFPELKESEDEKVRKALLELVHDTTGDELLGDYKVYKEEALAWLEKQRNVQRQIDDAYLEGMSAAKHELEKQGEQKPTDKVKPKFKIGEWITNGDYTWKIIEVKPLDYILQSQDGNIVDDTISYTDEQFHLWTIEDAKDGDVLVASDDSIFLFKGTIDCACKHYVALTTDGVVVLNEGLEHYWETSKATHPATKEQRDTLFAKIKEAGYEWDADKKELRKIEKQDDVSNKWNRNTDSSKPPKNHSVLMKTTYGISEGEWQGEQWLQYRWSAHLKDDEVLYWIEIHDPEKRPRPVAKKEVTGKLKEMLDNIDPVELEETKKEMMEESASTDDTFFDDYRKTDGEYDEVHISEHDQKSVHLQFTAEGRNISDFSISRIDALILAYSIILCLTDSEDTGVLRQIIAALKKQKRKERYSPTSIGHNEGVNTPWKKSPFSEKPITVNVDDKPDNPVEAYAKGVEEAKNEMMESMPTDEEVQKLHDHLEMHRELGDIPKGHNEGVNIPGKRSPIAVNVEDIPDNPVDAFAKGVEKARSEMKSEQQSVTFIDSGTMQVIEKLDEIIGKLDDISRPYIVPYREYPIPESPWYIRHGVSQSSFTNTKDKE